jgi:hypothetical protein
MSQDPDFKLLFDALPHLVLVLSPGPDFIMVAANERRLRGTNTRREDCIGRMNSRSLERVSCEPLWNE